MLLKYKSKTPQSRRHRRRHHGRHDREGTSMYRARGRAGKRAPGTRILVAELLNSQRERLSALFDQTLDVIKDAFRARKSFVVRGVIVDRGPDHYARLEAAKLFSQLTSSRR
jgi:hypothetical protein